MRFPPPTPSLWNPHPELRPETRAAPLTVLYEGVGTLVIVERHDGRRQHYVAAGEGPLEQVPTPPEEEPLSGVRSPA